MGIPFRGVMRGGIWDLLKHVECLNSRSWGRCKTSRTKPFLLNVNGILACKLPKAQTACLQNLEA